MNIVQALAGIRFAYLSWTNREALSKLPAEAKQAFKVEVIDNIKAGYNTPIEELNARDAIRAERWAGIGTLILIGVLFIIAALAIFPIIGSHMP